MQAYIQTEYSLKMSRKLCYIKKTKKNELFYMMNMNISIQTLSDICMHDYTYI